MWWWYHHVCVILSPYFLFLQCRCQLVFLRPVGRWIYFWLYNGKVDGAFVNPSCFWFSSGKVFVFSVPPARMSLQSCFSRGNVGLFFCSSVGTWLEFALFLVLWYKSLLLLLVTERELKTTAPYVAAYPLKILWGCKWDWNTQPSCSQLTELQPSRFCSRFTGSFSVSTTVVGFQAAF